MKRNIKLYSKFNGNTYINECPAGEIPAILVGKKWGKAGNMRLYFRNANTNVVFWLSVWRDEDHIAAYHAGKKPEQFDFASYGEPGDLFNLTVTLTRTSRPTLERAELITQAVGLARAFPGAGGS